MLYVNSLRCLVDSSSVGNFSRLAVCHSARRKRIFRECVFRTKNQCGESRRRLPCCACSIVSKPSQTEIGITPNTSSFTKFDKIPTKKVCPSAATIATMTSLPLLHRPLQHHLQARGNSEHRLLSPKKSSRSK